jgi:putative intracellular protease/amidase
VSAVCHGPAILAGIKDSKTGESILTGRKVTGFTDEGEKAVGALEAIEKWKKDTIQTSADKYGATYVSPSGPWEAFTQTDRRLVTGVNPQSAAKTAEETLKAFNGAN